jgi:hypothetical protein
MATLQDWITFPKEHAIDAWVRWGLKANHWMNDVRNCVSSLDTRLTSAESDIDDLEAKETTTDWQTYTPTLTNLSNATVSSARYIIEHDASTGKKIGHVYIYLSMTGSFDLGTIKIAFPSGFTAATHYRNRTGWYTVHLFDSGPTQIYEGVVKIESAGDSITIRRASDAAFWSGVGSVPVAVNNGDAMAINLTGIELV